MFLVPEVVTPLMEIGWSPRVKLTSVGFEPTTSGLDLSAISIFYLWVRASSPFCLHLDLGLFDFGLSFGVKEILLMFLSSAVQIYILKGNSWPFSPPNLIVKMYQ